MHTHMHTHVYVHSHTPAKIMFVIYQLIKFLLY